MTRSERIDAIATTAVELAKRHPASGLLKTYYVKLLEDPIFSVGHKEYLQRLYNVIGLLRSSSDENSPVDAMHSLSASMFLLGSCHMFKDHAAWAILHRLTTKRSKAIRASHGQQKQVQSENP